MPTIMSVQFLCYQNEHTEHSCTFVYFQFSKTKNWIRFLALRQLEDYPDPRTNKMFELHIACRGFLQQFPLQFYTGTEEPH